MSFFGRDGPAGSQAYQWTYPCRNFGAALTEVWSEGHLAVPTWGPGLGLVEGGMLSVVLRRRCAVSKVPRRSVNTCPARSLPQIRAAAPTPATGSSTLSGWSRRDINASDWSRREHALMAV